jgi:hypothetical protein
MQATRLIGCLGFALVAVPIGIAAAEDEAARFQALEERMRVLEDKLAASNATIEAQQELIQRAAPDVSQGSPMDGFFDKLEVSGGVVGSYLYNFNQPQHPLTSGAATQPLNQFNRSHDEFSLDAAKFELSKTAASPGEGGFALDLLYGQNGDILRGFSPTNPQVRGDSDMDVFVQEAYAAYNMGGVTWKMGKFETLMGFELLDSYKNPNVTHGLLFTWAIPLYHTGLLASGAFKEGVTWSLGLVDGFNNVIEQNDGKAYIGQLAMTSGGLFGALNFFWGGEGAEAGGNNPAAPGIGSVDDLRIVDLVLSYSVSDALSFWFNADLGEQEDQFLANTGTLGAPFNDSDPYYWGAALGAKFQVSEKLGFALRTEYFDDEDDMRGTTFGIPAGGLTPGVDDAQVELWSLTGTVSYKFAQNLMLRGELRWDHADNDIPTAVAAAGGGNIFPEGTSALDDDQYLGIVEMSYIFD